MKLAGRVVLVTGGSRGIGRACVLEAVARGARVVFCSREDGPESRAVESEAAATAGPGVALGLAADVSDETGVGRLFARAAERFGPVDGVVNNAAISLERLLVSTPTEDWEAVVATNLTGAFLVARQAVRAFLSSGRGGRIVAVGTLSQYGVSGNASYAASKGGLLGLTRRLAREYGRRGIAATMVVPGYVETALSAGMSASARRTLVDGCPLGRPGSGEEIAYVVASLLSAEAEGLNGHTILATGGLREVPS
jgi:3-oxoacyl-[acyl-carrier protein] reductase